MTPAVFFYFFDKPKPVRINTAAKPEDLDSIPEAAHKHLLKAVTE